MIINIRGTNGSGKSTIVRELMAQACPCRPLYGLLGARAPEAYRLGVADVQAPVFVLGPYATETGGCDAVHPFDLILQLLEKYAPRGHVVFEGSLVSDHYGKVGQFLEARGQDAVVAFMTTPLEECLRRVRGRRSGRGEGRAFNPSNTTRRYEAIEKVRRRMEDEDKVRVLLLPDFGAREELKRCVGI